MFFSYQLYSNVDSLTLVNIEKNINLLQEEFENIESEKVEFSDLITIQTTIYSIIVTVALFTCWFFLILRI